MALIIGGTTVTGTQTLDATRLTGNLPALNGSSLTNLSAGKVLQCVGNNISRAGASLNVTTQTATATSITQAITPTSASNKILILANFSVVIYDTDGHEAGHSTEIYRQVGSGSMVQLNDGTDVNSTGYVNSESNFKFGKHAGDYTLCYDRYNIHYFDDSYDSTDAITYKVYLAEMQVNDNYANVGAGSGMTNIMLMEIQQ